MPSLLLLKIHGAILARAKSLVAGGDGDVTQARPEDASFASKTDAGAEWGLTTQDKTFWAAMAGADRRLAELRRAIDQAAAESLARETTADASSSLDSYLGESRCETANRVITDALNAEKS